MVRLARTVEDAFRTARARIGRPLQVRIVAFGLAPRMRTEMGLEMLVRFRTRGSVILKVPAASCRSMMLRLPARTSASCDEAWESCRGHKAGETSGLSRRGALDGGRRGGALLLMCCSCRC